MNTLDMLVTFMAAAGDEKHKAPELAVLIVLPLVLSFVLLWFAKKRHGAPWQKWASLVPLIAGALMALDPFGDIRSRLYRDFHKVSDRSAYLHYASLIVPCTAILGIVAYILYDAHRERMEH